MMKLKNWIENALWSWSNCINFRFVEYNDNIDRCAFFEELNNGWYHMYIYPYDDPYCPSISRERESRLGDLPQEYIFYVSEEDYDALMEKLENPPPPSEALRKLFERKIPWDDERTT